MTEENLKAYFEIYTDCWKLFRKYSEPLDDDDFWEKLKDESNVILKKHGETEFTAEIVLATIKEINRLYKKRKRVTSCPAWDTNRSKFHEQKEGKV